MPVSRPLLITLAVAVLALAGFYATQGMRQSSSDDSTAAVVPPPPAAEQAAPKADSAAKPAKPRADRAGAEANVADKAKARAAAAKATQARRERAANGPAAINRALRSGKTVVILFQGPESADDSATERAVDSLRGKRGVAVFKAPIARLTAYGDLIGQLGIAQAPAVVIVDRQRKARVVEGYVDPPTLAQDVADSR